MTARQVAPRVAIILVILGLSAVSVRMSSRHKTLLARGDSLWQVAYSVDLQQAKRGAQVHAYFPLDTAHCRITKRTVSPGNLRQEPAHPSRAEKRDVVAAAPRDGDFHLEAVFEVHLSAQGVWRSHQRDARLSPDARAAYLRSEKGLQVESPLVQERLEQLRLDSTRTAELVDRIFEYCQTEIVPGAKEAPRDAEGTLKQRIANPLGRARAMIALCRAGKVPARLVTGFELKTRADVRPHHWVEVLIDRQWEPYDPENGHAGELPRTFVPVHRDGSDVVGAKGVTKITSTYSIRRIAAPEGASAPEGRRLLDILDLTGLPLEAHEILSLILLLPLGALVTVFFRVIIGIRTFGTFTPTLLALAFVYNDWRYGLVVFAAVMVVGLASRALLDRLKLLAVPRLSAILTLVVLCMAFGVSLWDYFDLGPIAQAVLLPMVILTMTVERFFVTQEEDGLAFSLRLLLSTLLVAFCCYMVLCWKAVGHMILAYPEIHLFTIAALILLGRYSGYRLTELWRFRDLAQPQDQ